MKGAFRCALFALLCAYGRAQLMKQCCVGTISGWGSPDVQQPRSELECYMRYAQNPLFNSNTNWQPCQQSCMALTCTGFSAELYTKHVLSCTTPELQTASIAGEQTQMMMQGYSGVQCVAAATHTCSTNSSGVTSCSCNPGYTASDGGPCSPCPYATYKDSIGQYPIVVLCCLSLYLSNVTHGVL